MNILSLFFYFSESICWWEFFKRQQEEKVKINLNTILLPKIFICVISYDSFVQNSNANKYPPCFSKYINTEAWFLQASTSSPCESLYMVSFLSCWLDESKKLKFWHSLDEASTTLELRHSCQFQLVLKWGIILSEMFALAFLSKWGQVQNYS